MPRSATASAGDLITGPRLAELVAESYSTIDYWSRVGLLEFERRGGTRLYDAASAADRCRRIRTRQNEGWNLVTIKQDLSEITVAPALPPRNASEWEPWMTITPEQLAELDAKFDAFADEMNTPEQRAAADAWFHTSPSEYNALLAANELREP